MFNALTETLQAPGSSGGGGVSPARRPHRITPADLGTTFAGRKVLIVDDNALNREVAADFLDLVGIKVSMATNGVEALKCLETESFDAVLMDVHMPEMDGLEATRLIRRRPEWRSLPIIALTAQARGEDRAVIKEAGMDSQLTKPIDETILYDTLAHFMSGKAAAVSHGHAEISDHGNITDGRRYVDTARMRARFGNHSEERMKRVLNGFLRDFSDAPDQFERLVEIDNLPELAELTHTLKGSFGYLGAALLEEQAEQIELAARRGDRAAIFSHHPGFVAALRKLLTEADSVRSEFETDPA